MQIRRPDSLDCLNKISQLSTKSAKGYPTAGQKGSSGVHVINSYSKFLRGQDLYNGINNLACETYHPKGWHVENVLDRQRESRTL
jgi:hypothetical protein